MLAFRPCFVGHFLNAARLYSGQLIREDWGQVLKSKIFVHFGFPGVDGKTWLPNRVGWVARILRLRLISRTDSAARFFKKAKTNFSRPDPTRAVTRLELRAPPYSISGGRVAFHADDLRRSAQKNLHIVQLRWLCLQNIQADVNESNSMNSKWRNE